MRFSERNERDGGMDETATGFIDIQFGLIAIFILLLTAATSGIGKLSNQLRGVEGGMSGVIDLLLCDWNGVQGDCESEDRNRFAGHGQSEIELIRPGYELVLVLGMTTRNGGLGLFRSGSEDFPLPAQIGREAMTTIRDRINKVLPCFAPFSRTAPGLSDRARQSHQDCDEVLDRFSGGAAPGIDLFQIEGHGDSDPIGTAQPLVALHRAQAVLYSLLVEPRQNESSLALIAGINALDGDGISRGLDEIMGSASSAALGDLFWLAPLGARIAEECRVGEQERRTASEEPLPELPYWCQRLLRPVSEDETQSADEQQTSASLPKLFAMTSYGRFSLRYGNIVRRADPRDRRVEFRLRGSIIPTTIHELFSDRDGPYFNNTRLFRLYSTDAVRALHQCDASREENASCLNDLDLLITSD